MPADLLGRHVGHGALHHTRSGELRPPVRATAPTLAKALGQAEVEHLHVPAGRQHDVRRLEVAMHDLRGVGGFQGFGDFHTHAKDVPDGIGAVSIRCRSVSPRTCSMAMNGCPSSSPVW